MHYFPDPDAPDLEPFTRAFVRLMFAHGEFERRVAEIMDVVTCEPGFGERPDSRWSARARPEKMRRLMRKHRGKHAAGLPETEDIVDYLSRSVAPSDVRNMLAHGHWWAFDTESKTITIRAGTVWPEAELHRNFTEAEIQQTATLFEELEVELFKFQRQIEKRQPPLPLEL